MAARRSASGLEKAWCERAHIRPNFHVLQNVVDRKDGNEIDGKPRLQVVHCDLPVVLDLTAACLERQLIREEEREERVDEEDDVDDQIDEEQGIVGRVLPEQANLERRHGAGEGHREEHDEIPVLHEFGTRINQQLIHALQSPMKVGGVAPHDLWVELARECHGQHVKFLFILGVFR